MSETLAAGQWDAAYAEGRYAGEPPLPFVGTIIDSLGDEGHEAYGLYVGCGNGRNYVPLLESGLRLTGIDISALAIEQLVERCPAAEKKVMVRDFQAMHAAKVWDYIVSIQTFQLGTKQTVMELFTHTHQALRPGGKLFLRVNAADTEIYHPHHTIESWKSGSKTIVYEAGSKKDMPEHFFSKRELGSIATKFGFKIMSPARKVTESRQPPKTGTWSQWETIWQRARS